MFHTCSHVSVWMYRLAVHSFRAPLQSQSGNCGTSWCRFSRYGHLLLSRGHVMILDRASALDLFILMLCSVGISLTCHLLQLHFRTIVVVFWYLAQFQEANQKVQVLRLSLSPRLRHPYKSRLPVPAAIAAVAATRCDVGSVACRLPPVAFLHNSRCISVSGASPRGMSKTAPKLA